MKTTLKSIPCFMVLGVEIFEKVSFPRVSGVPQAKFRTLIEYIAILDIIFEEEVGS